MVEGQKIVCTARKHVHMHLPLSHGQIASAAMHLQPVFCAVLDVHAGAATLLGWISAMITIHLQDTVQRTE